MIASTKNPPVWVPGSQFLEAADFTSSNPQQTRRVRRISREIQSCSDSDFDTFRTSISSLSTLNSVSCRSRRSEVHPRKLGDSPLKESEMLHRRYNLSTDESCRRTVTSCSENDTAETYTTASNSRSPGCRRGRRYESPRKETQMYRRQNPFSSDESYRRTVASRSENDTVGTYSTVSSSCSPGSSRNRRHERHHRRHSLLTERTNNETNETITKHRKAVNRSLSSALEGSDEIKPSSTTRGALVLALVPNESSPFSPTGSIALVPEEMTKPDGSSDIPNNDFYITIPQRETKMQRPVVSSVTLWVDDYKQPNLHGNRYGKYKATEGTNVNGILAGESSANLNPNGDFDEEEIRKWIRKKLRKRRQKEKDAAGSLSNNYKSTCALWKHETDGMNNKQDERIDSVEDHPIDENSKDLPSKSELPELAGIELPPTNTAVPKTSRSRRHRSKGKGERAVAKDDPRTTRTESDGSRKKKKKRKEKKKTKPSSHRNRKPSSTEGGERSQKRTRPKKAHDYIDIDTTTAEVPSTPTKTERNKKSTREKLHLYFWG